eukprot:GAFH01005903.1.p1 GENE.GAFH01005903.1~~GAFH01005903.1.p1  ORF type:complete len:131 (+),score=68.29 GAFH01005903.1:1-393(+)
MAQLSGGQKTLVSLAMIFAIQRVDPAPFYLFDEIDSALDPSYRSSVAKMVRKMSAEQQFIVSTFRPELVHIGDRFYAIQYRNKVSRIDVIEHEQAAEFVQRDMDAAQAKLPVPPAAPAPAGPATAAAATR